VVRRDVAGLRQVKMVRRAVRKDCGSGLAVPGRETGDFAFFGIGE